MIRRKGTTSGEPATVDQGVSVDSAELDRIVQARVAEALEIAVKTMILTTAPDGDKPRKGPQRHPSDLPCGTCGVGRAYSWHAGPKWNGHLVGVFPEMPSRKSRRCR